MRSRYVNTYLSFCSFFRLLTCLQYLFIVNVQTFNTDRQTLEITSHQRLTNLSPTFHPYASSLTRSLEVLALALAHVQPSYLDIAFVKRATSALSLVFSPLSCLFPSHPVLASQSNAFRCNVALIQNPIHDVDQLLSQANESGRPSLPRRFEASLCARTACIWVSGIHGPWTTMRYGKAEAGQGRGGV